MEYNWKIAGTMLHMLTGDSNITLCNRHVNGWSCDDMNERVGVYPTCKRCLKLLDQVARRA